MQSISSSERHASWSGECRAGDLDNSSAFTGICCSDMQGRQAMGYIVRRKCSLQCTSCACHVDMSTYTIMRKPNPAASQHPCFSLFSFFFIFFECFQVRLVVFYMTIVGQLQSIETLLVQLTEAICTACILRRRSIGTCRDAILET